MENNEPPFTASHYPPLMASHNERGRDNCYIEAGNVTPTKPFFLPLFTWLTFLQAAEPHLSATL